MSVYVRVCVCVCVTVCVYVYVCVYVRTCLDACIFVQIMAQLLDIKTLTRKPAYDMAPDQGLMLYACEFDSLPMFRSSRTF